MSKVMQRLGVGVLLASVVVLVGCEFESSGDSDTFNSGPSWVNFSGVYKAGGNGKLVSSFTSGSGSGTIGSTNFVIVTGEQVATGNGVNTVYSGTFNNQPIVEGSVTINAAGFSLTDNGAGVLSGSGASGAISYGTGAWSIDLNDQIIGAGVSIRADYTYVTTTAGSGGGAAGDQGSSGKAIFSFTVFQTGNKLEITDNNGARYTGQFGNVATTTGGDGSSIVPPSIGDSVVAEYTAKGTSASGAQVMMAGTFQGVVGRGSGTAMFLNDRRMLGTWVESKGVTGDINGIAAPIGISFSPTSDVQ